MNDNTKIEILTKLINELGLIAEADYYENVLTIKIENLNLNEKIDLEGTTII